MSKTARAFLFIVLTILLLTVVGTVAGYIWINRYLGSPEFCDRLSKSASHALGVEGKFQSLSWSGLSIYSPGFEAEGSPASPVDRLLVQDIHAGLNLAAAFHGVWKVDTIDIGQLNLSLKKPLPGPVVPPEPIAAAPGSSFLPSTFEVDAVRFHEVTLTWPPALGGGGTAQGMTFAVKHEGEGWQADGRKGTLAIANLPVQDVSKVVLRVRPDRIYLTEALLKNPEQGEISLSGEAGVGDASDIDLQGEVRGVPVTPLLPPDWRARFYGDLFGSWHLTSPHFSDTSWKLEGQAHFENALLEGLPVLDEVATFTRTKEYRSLKLQTLSFDYTLVPGQTDLKNLIVESEGLVRIEGAVGCNFAAGQTLDGLVQLGVPSSKLALLPGAQSQVFTESRGVYVWTPVRISGTLAQPVEDLSPRLTTAVKQAVEQKVQQGVESAVDLFNKLVRP